MRCKLLSLLLSSFRAFDILVDSFICYCSILLFDATLMKVFAYVYIEIILIFLVCVELILLRRITFVFIVERESRTISRTSCFKFIICSLCIRSSITLITTPYTAPLFTIKLTFDLALHFHTLVQALLADITYNIFFI